MICVACVNKHFLKGKQLYLLNLWHNMKTNSKILHNDLTSRQNYLKSILQTSMTTCQMLYQLGWKWWRLVRSSCWLVTCYVDLSYNFVVIRMALMKQKHILKVNFLTNNKERRSDKTTKDLTSQHNYLTSDGRNMPQYIWI